jgi:hypothetical protein
LLQLQEELGRPLRVLQEMPILLRHMIPVWEAFHLLSASRQVTMGGSLPIPFRDIIEYCIWDGINTKDGQRRYLRFIREMDSVYLSHANEKPEEPKDS